MNSTVEGHFFINQLDMNRVFKFALMGLAGISAFSLVSCSDNDKEPDDTITKTIGFENAPSQFFASDEYGVNLYYGAQEQITTGYLAEIGSGVYAQFSINYGYTYDADYNKVWGYSFFEGGIALSKYHNMSIGTYENQLSVYNTSSPSGGNFAVAFGSATDKNYQPIINPSKSIYSDFAGCGKIYITDAVGYTVKNPGSENSFVTGDSEDARFKSVYINNTTYAFDVMKNGNAYSSPLNEDNKGWFKVQFIAFEGDDPNDSPLGFVEAYLANFDPSQADGYLGIIDTWTKVDLSSLPEASILVINFIGSDSGEYGLNTPAYCALDKFEISID